MSSRNVQAPKCTLRSLEKEISRPSIHVDCQWSESHSDVTLAGEGLRLRDNQRVVLFYIPVNCTSKRHVMDRINSILDGLESTTDIVTTTTQGGADL